MTSLSFYTFPSKGKLIDHYRTWQLHLYYPYIGNDVVQPFYVYIDQTQHDNIDWTPPLIGTLLPSTLFQFTLDGWHVGRIWCACICQSDASVSLDICRSSRDPPIKYAPNNIIHKHLDDILANYESQLVQEEYQSMSATS